MTLDEIKNTQLEILVYVDKVCKENNIKYSIAYGTLIGAVRHKGFIPWDDDIDILLKRSEYNKLLDVLYKDNNHRFKTFSMIDEGYFYPYAKVSNTSTVIHEKNWPNYKDLGVNIDIFPIDYVPEKNPKEYFNKTMEYVRDLHNCLTDIAYAHDKGYMRLLKRLCRFREVRKCRKKGEWYWKNKLDEMTSLEKSSKMACIVDGDYCLWDSRLLDDYIDLSFENYKFCAVKKYDEMLKSYYGDYMKELPEEERQSNHDFTAYWK